MGLDDRTEKALGNAVMSQLRSLGFCIVGCGGTGANFAEMLVRSGATRLALIDGDMVKDTDLNRVFGFTEADLGKPKARTLKDRLECIRHGLDVRAFQDSFRKPEDILEDHPIGQQVRDAVYDADVVFVGTDTNTSRLSIEELCRDKIRGMLLSCGVRVDRNSGLFEFECTWAPKTPIEQEDAEGYGPENASFASIILEATAVAFTMLLSHLECKASNFRYYRREYDANFQPSRPDVNE